MSEPSEKKQSWVARVYLATLRGIESAWGLWAFAILSIGNSVILPLSPYFLLVPLCYAQPKRWLLFAFIATTGSVLGGLGMWAAGYFFWQSISEWMNTTMATLSGDQFRLFCLLSLLTIIALVLAYCAVQRRWRWLWNCTLWCGGLFAAATLIAYAVGSGTWNSAANLARDLFERWNPDMIAQLAADYQNAAFWSVVLITFSPIPYKVSAIACGVALIDPISFIIASIIGRGSRLYLTAGLVRFGGPYVRSWFERYLQLAEELEDEANQSKAATATRDTPEPDESADATTFAPASPSKPNANPAPEPELIR